MAQKEYHTGVVTDNQDSEKRGRLCVACPELLSNDTLEWVEPTFTFVDSSKNAGFFAIPSVGSQVEVEIDAEPDAEINGLNPKWRCAIYPNNTVPTDFESDYPNRMGFVSGTGRIFTIVCDDIRFGTSDATEHAVLGDAFMSDLNAYLAADITFFTMLAGSGLPLIATGATARKTAAETLQGQLNGDLATRVKVS